ncbi:MAG: membrane protein insertion efficiency factor YidD [candidate division WOR-3 bacterium]
MNRIFIFFIKIYKIYVSPLFPPTCRFTPTCSEYSLQAYQKYNFIKASFLTIKRILRCNPFSKGGYDPLE